MASDILDRVGMVITDTGAGALTAVTANTLIGPRFNTPAEAGAVNGASYWWMLEEGNDYEIFEGGWTASGTKVGRDIVWHSKISNVHGTTKMTLAGSATLRSITPAEAFNFILRVDKDQTAIFSAAQKAQGRSNIYAAPFDALAYNGMQINGSCDVSQEIGSSLVTAPAGYIVDGWQVFKSGTMVINAQQVADAPPGFSNSLKVTVATAQPSLGSTDAAVIITLIEGYRTSRLSFGTANAQPVSLGFWTKMHRTGPYSGAVKNGVANRSYPFSFTQNVADTWEFKAVTIPGDVTGTWVGNSNGVGLSVVFAVAQGVSNAGTANAWAAANYNGVTGTTNSVAATSDTYQITGLVVIPGIELPSAARAPFIMRPFDQELLTSLRYYEKSTGRPLGYAGSTNNGNAYLATSPFRVPKRVAPTMLFPTQVSSGIAFPFSAVTATQDSVEVEAAANFTGAYGFFISDWIANARL